MNHRNRVKVILRNVNPEDFYNIIDDEDTAALLELEDELVDHFHPVEKYNRNGKKITLERKRSREEKEERLFAE